MSRSAIAHSMMRQLAQSGGAPVSADPLALVDKLISSASSRHALAFYGNSRTLNIEALLAQHIAASAYFRDVCAPLASVEALCEHVAGGAVRHFDPYEPRGSPRPPSPAFCLLLRLGTLQPTETQVERMLLWPLGVRGGCGAYVRALAVLLLRYVSAPAELWSWLAAPAEDDSRLAVSAGAGGGGAAGSATTVGGWVRVLLENERHEGTLLPRIPAGVARDIGVALANMELDNMRAAANETQLHRILPGLALRARYSEDGEWYDAVVQRVDGRRVVVVYPDFPGSKGESRGLGQVELRMDPRLAPQPSGGSGGGEWIGRAGSREQREWEGRAGSGGEGEWGGRAGSREVGRDAGGGYDRYRRAGSGGSINHERERERRRSRSRSRERHSRSRSRDRLRRLGGAAMHPYAPPPPPLPPRPDPVSNNPAGQHREMTVLLARYSDSGAVASGGAPSIPRGDEHRHHADVDGEEVLHLGGR